MSRLLVVLAFLLLTFAAAFATQPPADEGLLQNTAWSIKIEKLPSPAFPAPPYLDHTQYRSVILKHETEGEQFEYSGTNAFTARIEAVSPDGG